MYSRSVRISLPLVASFILLIIGVFLFSQRTARAEPTYDCATVTEIPQIECETLVTLYNATNGGNWVDNSGWLSTNTPCSWFRVTCESDHVVQVNLYNNGLAGIIPAEIANLTYLTVLNLSYNELISGSIPPELGNLTYLTRLSLGRGQLSGSVPTELGNLVNLEQLDLMGNQLSGNLPSELGNLTLLEIFQIHENQLTGAIPPELGNLSNLWVLYISRNQLSGTIPTTFGNLASLKDLILTSNQLSGNIPAELGNLPNLRQISLESNQLSGFIPPELGNLPNLTSLNINTNQGLNGSLPQALTNLSLDYFDYYSTNVCEPANSEFQQWLASIANLDSTGMGTCAPAAIINLTAATGSGTGQIKITWPAPQGIASDMSYQIRHAGSTINTELGWTSAIPIAGTPTPETEGTIQNLLVRDLTLGQTYYFAIRTEYGEGSLSDLSNSPSAIVTEDTDLGFRSNPDGYQFVNPGFMQPTCLDFQSSYSGLGIQCANNQPQQKYQALFKDYRSTFSTGICTGMAASSLLYYTGAEPHPQPGTIFDLDFAQAQSNIATYHGRQHSKAVLDIVVPSWNSWTNDPAVISQRVDDVYNQIKTSLSSVNNNPLVLDLFPRSSCGTSGHTIVPYRLDDTDPLHPKVYVYENFNPDNANKFIQFDLAASTHSFSYWLWDSTSCGTLIAIPVNTFTSSDGKIPGTQLHVSTGGNVEPLLINNSGDMIGYNNGVITTTVTNAMPVFPWRTPSITPTVTSFLTPPDMYTTTLSSSGGGYTFTVWSSSGTLELQADEQTTSFTNSFISTTSNDLISFDADLHSAVLSTGDAQGQSVALQMTVPDTSDSQVYTLDNVNLLAGGDLTVDALDSELHLASNGLLTSYDIYFDHISTQTLSAFAYANVELLANDNHIIVFSGEDDAILQIDHGGDGSIDETVVLENQAISFSIYLPTILR